VGTALWPVPFEAVGLPGQSPFASWLLVATVLGILTGLALPGYPRDAILAVLYGAAGSLFLGAAWESMADLAGPMAPQSHVLIAATITAAAGLTGIGLTRVNPSWWSMGK
jgi:hypothetical protein